MVSSNEGPFPSAPAQWEVGPHARWVEWDARWGVSASGLAVRSLLVAIKELSVGPQFGSHTDASGDWPRSPLSPGTHFSSVQWQRDRARIGPGPLFPVLRGKCLDAVAPACGLFAGSSRQSGVGSCEPETWLYGLRNPVKERDYLDPYSLLQEKTPCGGEASGEPTPHPGSGDRAPCFYRAIWALFFPSPPVYNQNFLLGRDWSVRQRTYRIDHRV